AAAPDDDAVAVAERRQDLVLVVEERRAADAEDERLGGLRHFLRERIDVADERVEVLLHEAAFLEPGDSLVALEAGELELPGGGPDRGEDLAAFVERADAGPPPFAAAFQQDAEGPLRAGLLPVAREVVDALDAVEAAVDVQRGIFVHRERD